ncbi:hypothetical protein FJ434_02925 [Mesorhizobium sp. B2-5-13]|uniref:hypothetical protein n=1 Tax=unclassified Mesorhizobium TaxID=325217 RepID=UPI00112842FB|nr:MULTISPECIES: hypothetical protein [unclassified Mesorhizobium]TPJ42684.1 hypothetical protein FJ432_09660 [Mesorhizobium sp. B2-6-5]TPJ93659.1 hypothetical protein FJ434_02925 [Mesorhizobium sp. B2-5-13]TPK48427.1 hypothetical protein FJ560_14715 [Mesorhizobium sp. B2-5-5]
MKKSLLSALGLAAAIAFAVPVVGATSADAAPMAKHHHHRHHYHHRYHHRYHHHHMKKMGNKA